MVHPIAGRGQYPFTIDGIIVDGAKINGQTFVKDLFIYKQRSYNMYDLIDADGVVYEFIEITWINDYTKLPLNFFDNSSFSVQFIPDNTFFIKVQDIPRNIFGFITLMQSNKVKVHTGDYIYYNQNDDYSLLSVRCIPATSRVKQGETVTIDVEYMPLDYQNTGGKWTIENVDDGIIQEDGRSRTSSATFTCLTPGHAIVSFDPDANSLLTATAHIFVEEAPPTYNSFSLFQKYTAEDYRYFSPSDTFFTYSTDYYNNAKTYFPGDEVTLSVVFTPYGYVPPEELDIIFDTSVFEYIGTDNNIDYKLKVLETTDADTNIQVTVKDGNISASTYVLVRQPTDSMYASTWGATRVRPGNQYQYRLSQYSKPAYGGPVWGIEGNSSIATIDANGLCTVHGEGNFRVTCTINGTSHINLINVYSNANIPDFVYYTPDDRYTYNVGDEIQLEPHFLPESVSVTGKWASSSTNNGYYTISDTGVLKILKAPANKNTSFTVGYNPDTSMPSSQISAYRYFQILPEGEVVTPTALNASSGYSVSNIPVGAVSRSYITVSPTETTVSKNWSYTVDDPSIVKAEQYPGQCNNFNGSYLYLTALKKGSTTITITVDNYPNLTRTLNITAF